MYNYQLNKESDIKFLIDFYGGIDNDELAELSHQLAREVV